VQDSDTTGKEGMAESINNGNSKKDEKKDENADGTSRSYFS
jgi:hypothetical protein